MKHPIEQPLDCPTCGIRRKVHIGSAETPDKDGFVALTSTVITYSCDHYKDFCVHSHCIFCGKPDSPVCQVPAPMAYSDCYCDECVDDARVYFMDMLKRNDPQRYLAHMGQIDLTRALAISPQHAVIPAELEWLAKRAQYGGSIIEVGSYRGRSTRALGDHCLGTVYAVDPWAVPMTQKADEVYAAFTENLRDLIDSRKVRPQKMTARQFLEGPGSALMVDLIFLDGDHDYQAIKWEIEQFQHHLTPYGILCGHDYDPAFPGVVRAVDELLGPVNHCEAIWWRA